MRILLLQLNVNTKQGQGYTYQIGCGYLMSVLRAAGHDVSFHSVTDSDPNALERVLDCQAPQVVGIYVVAPMEKYLGRVARRIKERQADAMVVVGGPHPTIYPELIEGQPDVDAVFRGEGELQLAELARRIDAGEPYTDLAGFRFRVSGNIIDNPLAPLLSEEQVRALPSPEHGEAFGRAIAEADGLAHFMFSRGCPFACTYCSNEAFNRLFGFQFRVRAVDQALEEIDDALTRHRIDVLGFDDDILTLKKDWFDRFIRRYRDEIHRPFFANVRVGTISDDQLRLMKEAGCRLIQIGIESGDPDIRERVLGRKMSNKAIVSLYQKAHAIGLDTMSFNMVGLPYETPKAFMETVRLNAAIQPNMAGLHVFYPYRGTKAAEMCAAEGWIASESDDVVEREESILEMPQFSREEIRWSYRNFYRLIREEAERQQSVTETRNRAGQIEDVSEALHEGVQVPPTGRGDTDRAETTMDEVTV